jgi:hypothetical protein
MGIQRFSHLNSAIAINTKQIEISLPKEAFKNPIKEGE